MMINTDTWELKKEFSKIEDKNVKMVRKTWSFLKNLLEDIIS